MSRFFFNVGANAVKIASSHVRRSEEVGEFGGDKFRGQKSLSFIPQGEMTLDREKRTRTLLNVEGKEELLR